MFECENNLTKLAYLSRKNCREQFLTSRCDGPKGGRCERQAIKSARQPIMARTFKEFS